MTPLLRDLRFKLDNFAKNAEPILSGTPVFDPKKYGGDLISIDKDCEIYNS